MNQYQAFWRSCGRPVRFSVRLKVPGPRRWTAQTPELTCRKRRSSRICCTGQRMKPIPNLASSSRISRDCWSEWKFAGHMRFSATRNWTALLPAAGQPRSFGKSAHCTRTFRSPNCHVWSRHCVRAGDDWKKSQRCPLQVVRDFKRKCPSTVNPKKCRKIPCGNHHRQRGRYRTTPYRRRLPG